MKTSIPPVEILASDFTAGRKAFFPGFAGAGVFLDPSDESRAQRQFFRRLLSVPIFWKVMGIGALVAFLFGGVTLWQTRAITSRVLYGNLEQQTLELAHSISVQLEDSLMASNPLPYDQQLGIYLRSFPDLRYIVVRDEKGRVVGHISNGGVAENLDPVDPASVNANGLLRVFPDAKGLLYDAVYPILGGQAGQVEVALTDQTVAGQLSVLSQSILWILLFCVAVGVGLAWTLAHFLTRPINLLDKAARTVGEGELSTKAEVFYEDEVGRLAVTFNQMTENLQKYRQELLEKEKNRLFLLDKIVRAQEEERRTISRELHDQMGQSLSAILMGLQSDCPYRVEQGNRCHSLADKIRNLIEEVRRLAWNMRPSILDDYGLDSALARYAQEMSKKSGIAIDYQYVSPPGSPRLWERVETTLYRITQEAVTNVIRHSSASRASIVVIQHQHDVTLLVEDNGRGFNPDDIMKDGFNCIGITGMKERAGLVGGTLMVESEPEIGTMLKVRIPFEMEAVLCPSAS